MYFYTAVNNDSVLISAAVFEKAKPKLPPSKKASQTVNSEVTKYGLEVVTTDAVVFQTVQQQQMCSCVWL